jgi:predicted hotdog family 3-hydroxylacyl-ACP dehydratase
MNHDAICARLPHAGRMCLLDRLGAWDGETIVCYASSHRDADNPLRSHGRLHAVTGVEYAAQAMALHSQLLAAPDAPPVMGYLAGVRDLKLDLEDLGAVRDDLHISARRLGGDAGGFIYEFEIRAGDKVVLSGRLTAKLIFTGVPA